MSNGKTAGDWAGTVCGGIVLGGLNAVVLFGTYVLMLLWESPGTGDADEVRDVTLLLPPGALLVAGLTWVFVKAEWLRPWWYALPVLWGTVALVRLAL